MAEERKIVKSGNSSFIVALPIGWIHKNKLDKGSTVSVNENEVGDLVIAKLERKKSQTDSSKTINIDGKSFDKINFEIISAYIQDYQNIIMEGKDIISQSSTIREIIGNCIGLEVLEQDKKNIFIKNFSSNDESLSPRTLIRKMTIIIEETFKLISQFTKEGFSQKDVKELQELLNQNSRLYFLTRKSILRAIENPVYIRTFQTTYHQITKDKIIAYSFNQLVLSLNSLGNILLFIQHTKEDSAKLKEIIDLIKNDYESLLSNLRYKNPESLGNLHERCIKNSLKLKYMLRETKNYFIIESSIHLAAIIEIIKHISFELAE